VTPTPAPKVQEKIECYQADVEERAVDTAGAIVLVVGARMSGILRGDQFEFELHASRRRRGTAHRKQIGRRSEGGQRQRDEVGGVGERRVEALDVASRTGERLPLTTDAVIRRPRM
jgi:hypothetical protein